MSLWITIALTGLGCYALKLAGLVMPRRVLDGPRMRRFADLIPVALLSALVAVQSLTQGAHLHLDGPRLAGLGVTVAALVLRAPFLAVVLAAAATAALLRLG